MTTQQQLSFENDHLIVNVKREPGCKIFLDVNVTPLATQASHQKAIAVIRKDVSIPGFRKGKVPEAMIVQKYAKYIDQEWKDIVLKTSLDESINLTKIFPFNRESVKSASILSISKEEGSKLTFEYETFPEIPTIQTEGLSLSPVKLQSVREKDVEEFLENLLFQNVEWRDIQDRPVQEGDFVLIDIDDVGDSPKNICTDSLFSVKKGKMGEWMLKLLIGKNPGQTIEGMSEKEEPECAGCDDESHHHEQTDFIPTLCRLTLHKIREANTPELNDDLAKKYGATNVEQLKERIKVSLENRATEQQKDRQRKLIEEALLNLYSFDIPASLIQNEMKGMKKKISANLREDGIEESKISLETKKIEEELFQKFNRDFRIYFLMQKYANDHNIVINQDEVMKEIMRQMWLKQMGKNTLDTSTDMKEKESQVKLQLLVAKSLDEINEKAMKLPKKA